MDKARAAVSDFMTKAGHHDTTVHETVAKGVTHESIKPTHHEETTTAVDREVHQDHYHTSVQPVLDREVLPEQHHHNLVAVEHRKFDHGNAEEVKRRLAEESAQYIDKSERMETTHTRAAAPTVGGEHIHHHVHEIIQPIVQKETLEPHVTHTTVPIHEVHHNAAQHHTASALPALSMADFKKQGGVLHGREERYDGFEGEPKSIGGALTGNHSRTGDVGLGNDTGSLGHHNHHGSAGAGVAGTTGMMHNSKLADKADPRVDSDHDGSHNMGMARESRTSGGPVLDSKHNDGRRGDEILGTR